MLSATPFVHAQDITMWKADPQHTGLNANETVLTPAIVNDSTKFAPLFFQKLDGQVYGAPLFMSAKTLSALPGNFADGKSHNVVYVVTQHDSVYAFDADADPLGANTTGNDSAPLWHTSFLQPNALGTPTTVPYTDAAGNDISPEFGITTTPVIDPASGTLFVVSLVKFPGQSLNNLYRQELHALDLKTGLDKVAPSVLDANLTFKGFVYPYSDPRDHDPVVAPTGQIPFSPLHEHLRGAMAFDAKNNLVYLSYSSHSDENHYYGLVLGFNGSTLQLAHSFVVTPNGATTLNPATNSGLARGGGAGGIWQGGAGAALDENQNLIFVTGNGPFDQDPNTGSVDWGETALKLPAAMAGQQQYQMALSDSNSFFTPSNWNTLNMGGGAIPNDSDLGAGGALLIPPQQGGHPKLMMFGGKAGLWYLVDRQVLGGIVANDAQVIQELPEPRAPQLTITPSYFNGSVYYAPSGSPMVKRALIFDNVNNVTTISTTPTVGTGGNINAPKGASAFITSNGTANGIVWALDGNVHAYDANTMVRLNSAFNNDISAPDGSGRCQTTKFSTMIVANAHAYYTCYSGTAQGFLVVAGLKSAAATTPAAPSGLTVNVASATSVNLSWTNNASTDPSLAGFHIFRATSSSGSFTQLPLTAQVSSFTDSTAAPNTQYFYRVTAFNNVGDSAPSNTKSATTYPTYVQPGLIGYWPMEDSSGNTVTDATGNGHTGSLATDGEALYTPSGYINGGWSFHGTKIPDNITVQDSPALDFTAAQSFTLATWVKVDALSGIEQPIILKSANNGNVYGLLVNGNNQFAMRGPSGDVAGPAVTASKWTHVALVQNGPAGTRTLYVNGQAVAQGAAQAANGTGTLEWGEEDLPAGSNQVQFGFQGAIDETRLYNTALTASQIADLLPVTLLDASSLLSSGTPDQLGTTLFPVTAPVSEARVSQTPGSYVVVAHFAKAVTGIAASLAQQNGAAATGSVGAITYDGTRTVVSIPLTGIADGQKLNLHLSGIVANDNTSVLAGTADIAVTVLEGDVNGDGVVNNNDVTLENSIITNAAVLPSNASFDINGDGSLTSADSALISSRIPGNGTAPPAVPSLSATVGSTSVALSWTASANATSYTVLRGTASGNETPLVANLTGTSYTDSAVTAGGTYFYTVEALNGSTASRPSNEVQGKIPAGSTGNALVQIDAGSSTAVSTFAADEFFAGGSVTGNVGAAIDMSKVVNAAPMAVYQSNHYGNFTYTIPNLITGTAYTVRLHFAETYWPSSGSRVFHVIANQGLSTQQTLLSNFDIVAKTGAKNVAYSQDFVVTATNNQIVLAFITDKDNALVSGIEVLTTNAAPPPPATTDLVAIASGTTSAVGTFAADEFFAGGSVTGNVGVAIDMSKVVNPAPMAVYQSNRYGNFTYTIPNVITGTAYKVRLHFAETYWPTQNSRTFDVIANQGSSTQQTLLTNFDIVLAAGGKDVAYSRDFSVTAVNNQITLTFKTDIDNALVSGIEVLKP